MSRRRNSAAVVLPLALILSSAAAYAQSCQVCALALDPSASQSFTAGNGAQVGLTNCGLAVNSNHAQAFYATGGANVRASSIQVTGGSLINNGASATPVPTTGATAVTDPFASLPAPTAGSCTSHPDYTQWGTNGQYEIYPGTYCNGLVISNGITAHFNPERSIYVINGGGIQFGSATITGSEVMFYLTGSNVTNSQLATIANGAKRDSESCRHPGHVQGVLFLPESHLPEFGFEQRRVAGGFQMHLTGALYFH